MAHRFEKGKNVYFLFRNGFTVQDSQLKPRYYLNRKKAEEYLPYGDEIVEYAPVVRCKDCKHRADATEKGNYLCNRKMLGLVRPDDFCSFGERKDGEG